MLEKKTKDTPEYGETELILNGDGSVYHLNLLPENIADVIIAVGDPGRVYRVSSYFDDIEFEMNRREFITHTGFYKGKRISVISTGIGTDNIEILLTELDALVNINLKTRREKAKKTRLKIIRVGTSGALKPEIKLGSHLVSLSAMGFDSLMEFYPYTMNPSQLAIALAMQEKLTFGFTPYLAECSPELKNLICDESMVGGNTFTAPGFYAPQGRKLRLPVANPNFLEELADFEYDGFGISNFEMETSAYYALGNMLGHEVLSLNAIIANRATGKFSKSPNKVVDSLIKKVLDRIKDKL
jgi:uridine phosphorylase